MNGDMIRRPAVKGWIVACMLLAVVLSGCVHDWDRPVATAEWHQPELWDAFPEDGTKGGYQIRTNDIGAPGKSASQSKNNIGETLGVTKNGDIQYILQSPEKASSGEIWKRVDDMFNALSLPDPSLNRDFMFTYGSFQTYEVWEQPEVWESFPVEKEVDDYKVFSHDSLKVAFRADRQTSEWLRVNETGTVSFRFELRGGVEDEGPFASENLSATAWERLKNAFEELSLPEPALNQSHEFGYRPWEWNRGVV